VAAPSNHVGIYMMCIDHSEPIQANGLHVEQRVLVNNNETM